MLILFMRTILYSGDINYDCSSLLGYVIDSAASANPTCEAQERRYSNSESEAEFCRVCFISLSKMMQRLVLSNKYTTLHPKPQIDAKLPQSFKSKPPRPHHLTPIAILRLRKQFQATVSPLSPTKSLK